MSATSARAQTPESLFAGWDDLLESLPTDESDAEALLHFWQTLLEQPLLLDAAAVRDVDRLPYLSAIQKAALTARLSLSPALASLDALAGLPGFDADTARRLAPFVAFTDPETPGADRSPPRTRIEILQRFSRDLDLRSGFRSDPGDSIGPAFSGSPLAAYTRLRLDRGGASVRFAMEKDAGEALSWEPNRGVLGMDHVAGSISWSGRRWLRRLVVGDYLAQAGHGLLLGAPYRAIAGAAPTLDPLVSGSGLSPYGSAGESAFFRGAAVEVAPLRGTQLLVFASRRALAASIDTVLTDTGPLAEVRAINRTGLHRTATERARRGVLRSNTAGFRLLAAARSWSVGIVHVLGQFDMPIAAGDALYEAFDFRGRRQSASSAFARYGSRSAHLFAEYGRTAGGGDGLIVGGQIVPDPRLEALFVARRFQPAFAPLYGNAFRAAGSIPQNEEGVYLAIRITPSRRWSMAGYIDRFGHPWPRTGLPLPGQGREASIRLNVEPAPYIGGYLQYRQQQTETGGMYVDAAGRVVDGLYATRRRTFRLHASYTHSPALLLRMRADWVLADRPGKRQRGVLLYSDITWRPATWLRLTTRFASFASTGADATAFAYEDDVYSRFIVAQYAGNGDRFYILMSYRAGPALTFEVKFERASYPVDRRAGSGPDLFEGPRFRTVRMQLRWKHDS
ncbi:MAG: hypothetical protein SH809_21175 [Rhodothermales bacterium]|nr:hypothetical protein [Rhodothermales bacterium]